MRGTERLVELATSTPRVESIGNAPKPFRPVLAADKQSAECSFVEGAVLRILETDLPPRDLHECFAHTLVVAQQAEMSGNPACMSGDQIVLGEPLLGEIPSQIAIDQIDIAESPEVEALQVLCMELSQRGLDIAELVSAFWRER